MKAYFLLTLSVLSHGSGGFLMSSHSGTKMNGAFTIWSGSQSQWRWGDIANSKSHTGFQSLFLKSTSTCMSHDQIKLHGHTWWVSREVQSYMGPGGEDLKILMNSTNNYRVYCSGDQITFFLTHKIPSSPYESSLSGRTSSSRAKISGWCEIVSTSGLGPKLKR